MVVRTFKMKKYANADLDSYGRCDNALGLDAELGRPYPFFEACVKNAKNGLGLVVESANITDVGLFRN